MNPACHPALHTRTARAIAFAQGGYFVVTGVWPFVHMRSFLWITGPKTDLWLVETVGATVAAIGVTLLVAASRRAVSFEIALLGILAAVALGGVETWYALQERIRWVYLGDAALEVAFIIGWSIALTRGPSAHSPGM